MDGPDLYCYESLDDVSTDPVVDLVLQLPDGSLVYVEVYQPESNNNNEVP